MKTWVRKSLKVGVLSAGIILFAGGAAQANDATTSDNEGLLNGNQILADVTAEANVCGNAIGILGDSAAMCEIDGSGSGEAAGAGAMQTTGNEGVGSGNQVQVPVHVPINVCGNAIGVLGQAAAACEPGSAGGSGYGSGASTEAAETGDNGGALTGNQILASISAPINACGNAVSVAGDSAAACTITSGGGGAEGLGALTTGENGGLLTGNQVGAILNVPINVCGNAVAVLGDASASCGAGDTGGDDGGDDGDDDGDGGSDGGDGYGESSRGAAESLPVFNSLRGLTKLTGVLPLGQADRHGTAEGAGALSTGGSSGVANGNQVLVDGDLAANVTGNAVGVLGGAVGMAR